MSLNDYIFICTKNIHKSNCKLNLLFWNTIIIITFNNNIYLDTIVTLFSIVCALNSVTIVIFAQIIKVLELGGAGERLSESWSQLVVFGHARRLRLVERLLEAMCACISYQGRWYIIYILLGSVSYSFCIEIANKFR